MYIVVLARIRKNGTLTHQKMHSGSRTLTFPTIKEANEAGLFALDYRKARFDFFTIHQISN